MKETIQDTEEAYRKEVSELRRQIEGQERKNSDK